MANTGQKKFTVSFARLFMGLVQMMIKNVFFIMMETIKTIIHQIFVGATPKKTLKTPLLI